MNYGEGSAAVNGILNAIPIGRWKHWVWDHFYNVDTRGIVPTLAPHGVRYEATSPQQFQRLMQLLPLETVTGSTFVDFGSGKGRVLLMAAAFPFRRIAGVEYNRELHEVAVRNIAGYRGSRRCAAIESWHGDAASYPLPAGPLVLFFNNPFDATVMAAVVANLVRSLEEEPRAVAILCVTRWTKTALIETIPGIRLQNRGPDDALYLINQ